ncbi:hypothetical protein GCM10027610_052260 [Dactylosporangium cerinum]
MRNSLAVTAPPASGPPAGPAPGGARRHRDDRRVAWLFLAPVLVGFAVFYLYPTVRGVWYSLTDYNPAQHPVIRRRRQLHEAHQ